MIKNLEHFKVAKNIEIFPVGRVLTQPKKQLLNY